MPGIKKECCEKILARSESDGKDLVSIIEQFAGEPHKEGASYKTKCPLCGSERSLVITPGKKLFKCFNCNQLSGKRPIDYLMAGEKMSYPDAIEWLGRYYNILIEYDDYGRKEKPKAEGAKFCHTMLEGSGLSEEDVKANCYDSADDTCIKQRPTFKSGTMNNRGEIVDGDDAVIYYYDLDGRPATYVLENDKTATTKIYHRVRYQFPDDHKDRNGRSMKYRSPAGSPTFLYFPQKVRDIYQKKEELDTLFIQEGEKKAEKACKHGIMSVAVSGIQNLGFKGTLPEEIIKLIDVCKVRQVIFLLDSDCFDLTSNITIDDPIDRRPKNFFYAVKNFKEYFNRLKNRDIYIEIYFGYVLKNGAGDKGIDDLLADSLKGKEDALKKDIMTALNEKNLLGQYVQLHKITTATDAKILEVWSLNSIQDFCKKYYQQLKNLSEFTYGKRRVRFDADGNVVSAQPIEPDEEFWTVRSKKGSDYVEYNFRYVGAENFLEHRGFYRLKRANGGYDLVHVDSSIVRTVQYWEIGDFVRDFTKDYLPKDVLEMLYRGGVQYLGPNNLTMLSFYDANFELPSRGVQRFYFKTKWWQITADKIAVNDYTQLRANIWSDWRKDFDVNQSEKLIDIIHDDNGYSYKLTDTGRKCDFLRFLENASNFSWRKSEPTPSDISDNAQHLISKMSAFGYMATSLKDKSISKAVVGMDGKQSDVGVSNGRSGKSLFGEALKIVTTTRHYNGKDFCNSRSNRNVFMWDGVDEKTKIVFIDDCMQDFDFELLFSLITGDWPINEKGQRPYILPFRQSPKIYITTNHAINGDGSSFVDRQWQVAFSDYYNDEHKPVDDFKTLFFDEWDAEQWNLFWNFVVECVQVYFRYGYVAAPGDRLEKRKLLQEVGEEFVLWADEYFSDESHVNNDLLRKDLYESLLDYVGPNRKAFYSPKAFKAKIIKYCKLKDYIFNPQIFNPKSQQYRKVDRDGRPVMDDKRNGQEHFIIGTMDFYQEHPDGALNLFEVEPAIIGQQQDDDLPY